MTICLKTFLVLIFQEITYNSVSFGLYSIYAPVDRADDGKGDRPVAPTLTRHIWLRRVIFVVVPSQSEPGLLRMILIRLTIADL